MMLAAAMSELTEKERAFATHGRNQTFEAGQHRGIVQLQGALTAAVTWMHGNRFRDDRADAAARDVAKKRDEAVADLLFFEQVGRGRGAHEPVAGRARAVRDGRKYVGVRVAQLVTPERNRDFTSESADVPVRSLPRLQFRPAFRGLPDTLRRSKCWWAAG